MAYSDYGGYAYRNGVRVEARSDYTLGPDGGGFGIPGMWPGFAAMLSGKSHAEALAIARMPNGHAVIGDGPVFVCLYKQSSLNVYRGLEPVDLLAVLKTEGPGIIEEYEWEGKKSRYVNTDHFTSSEEPCEFEIDGHKLTVYWRIEDNHYQYVRLEQPDGNVWHGWSGYGVGAGLEECGYGFSTEDREAELWRLFARPTPESTDKEPT